MLRLDDYWVWDSWVADDGETYHLFFLHAPRVLADPGLRHASATIGHATSRDLVQWSYHGPALGPDPAGWDDLALWTGSVVRADDGTWRMFYTAISNRGHGLRDQRIGIAASEDLFTWRRVLDRPVVVPDTRWYKTLEADPSASETWRDPFVFRDPGGDGWRMLITARARGAPPGDDGVLAQARSHDLLTWDVGPPACAPGAGFGELEVPQVRVVDGSSVLMFTCHPREQSARRIAADGRYCTWSVTGDNLAGPWDIAAARPLLADHALFAAPLIQRRDGSWALIGFRNLEPEGLPSFEITDPLPVRLAGGALIAADVSPRPVR